MSHKILYFAFLITLQNILLADDTDQTLRIPKNEKHEPTKHRAPYQGHHYRRQQEQERQKGLQQQYAEEDRLMELEIQRERELAKAESPIYKQINKELLNIGTSFVSSAKKAESFADLNAALDTYDAAIAALAMQAENLQSNLKTRILDEIELRNDTIGEFYRKKEIHLLNVNARPRQVSQYLELKRELSGVLEQYKKDVAVAEIRNDVEAASLAYDNATDGLIDKSLSLQAPILTAQFQYHIAKNRDKFRRVRARAMSRVYKEGQAARVY